MLENQFSRTALGAALHRAAQRRESRVHLATDTAGPRPRQFVLRPQARVPLGEKFGDRQRIPYRKAIDVQAGHQPVGRVAPVTSIGTLTQYLDLMFREFNLEVSQ